MEINLLISSPCNLKLYKFPFGEYECKLTLLLGNNEQMKWEHMQALGDYYVLHYNRSHDLSDFYLRNLTVNTHSNQLTFTIYLSGQAMYHVTNTFSPSCLMFVICYSTLYFNLHDFNERIMASLTSLLVLVSLSAQTATTTVKTPYLKALDLWYVLLIYFCFLVVISNVVVNSLLLRERKTPVMVMKMFPREDHDARKKWWCWWWKDMTAAKCNVVCRVVLLAAFSFVLFGYTLVATGLIL